MSWDWLGPLIALAALVITLLGIANRHRIAKRVRHFLDESGGEAETLDVADKALDVLKKSAEALEAEGERMRQQHTSEMANLHAKYQGQIDDLKAANEECGKRADGLEAELVEVRQQLEQLMSERDFGNNFIEAWAYFHNVVLHGRRAPKNDKTHPPMPDILRGEPQRGETDGGDPADTG